MNPLSFPLFKATGSAHGRRLYRRRMTSDGPGAAPAEAGRALGVFIRNCSFGRGTSWFALCFHGCHAGYSEELVHRILGSLPSVTVSRYLTPVSVTRRAVSPSSLEVIL